MTDEEFEQLMADISKQPPPPEPLPPEPVQPVQEEEIASGEGYKTNLAAELALEERRTFLTEEIRRLEADLKTVNENINTIYGTVVKGAIVKVVGKARNTPAGMVGIVFWMGSGYRGEGTRCGLTDEHGSTFWAPESSVRPVKVPPEVRKRLKKGAKLAADAYTVQKALSPKP